MKPEARHSGYLWDMLDRGHLYRTVMDDLHGSIASLEPIVYDLERCPE